MVTGYRLPVKRTSNQEPRERYDSFSFTNLASLGPTNGTSSRSLALLIPATLPKLRRSRFFRF